MSGRRGRSFPWAVVVFGDGTLPEVLLTCLQYRLAADLFTAGRADFGHIIQLRRHVDPSGCRRCRCYLVGRLAEKAAVLDRHPARD